LIAERNRLNMTLRQKAFLAIIFAVINFIGSISLALYVNQRFVWLVFILPAVAGIYSLTLRCENCGTPMYKRRIKIWDMEFTYWGGIRIPRNCSHCGTNFNLKK